MLPITEKLLMEAGGWKAMKEARGLHAAKRVLSATYKPPVLRGLVQEGNIQYHAGLVIKSATDIENLCTCAESRRYGTICAHSLALGLANIQHNSVPNSPFQQPDKKPPSKATAPVDFRPRFVTEEESGAVSAQLHLIIPPNLAVAFAKGQIPLSVEIEQGGRKTPLGGASTDAVFKVPGEDLLLLQKLREHTGSALPGMCLLNKEVFHELLAVLRGHERVNFGRSGIAVIHRQPLKLPLEIAETSGALELRVELPMNGDFLDSNTTIWCLKEGGLQEICPGLPAAYRPLLKQKITIDTGAVAAFRQKELPALSAWFTLPEGFSEPPPEVIPTVSLYLEGSLNYLEARLDFHYPANSSGNSAFEKAASEKLVRWGFRLKGGLLELKGNNSILNFLAEGLSPLERDWKLETGERFKHVTTQVDRVQIHVDMQGWGEDWFTLTVGARSGDGKKLDPAEIQRLLQLGQSHARQSNGRIALINRGAIEEFQESLGECVPDQIQPGSYRISGLQAGFVQSSIDQLGVETGDAWRRWREENSKLSMPPEIQLGPLEKVLRPYQKEGVRWMLGLAANGLGGILADEMGLGKTIQTLAMLRQHGGRTLVVCPTSLLENWKSEAAKFTPELQSLVISGSQRQSLFAEINKADLVITSYALLRRDETHYKEADFATIVLDEAHHIKNPETQSAQAAFRLKAKARFVLTGTPMENSVRDLWSVMHFVIPGYMGNRKDFAERYEKPMKMGDSQGIRERLARRLSPFLLRRLKSKVASELPEKLQQVVYADLTVQQEQVYRDALERGRQKADDARRTGGSGQARFSMLSTLTRLRQICCDLRLLSDDGKESACDSGKTELFEELLLEAIDGGHRVLVFSQFVRMLTVLRGVLEKSGLEYCYLDGSTKNRQVEVERFQNSTEIPVFLISLKAGGVGLNLTRADTVIHFDPWWNPAVEDQATDRAHRIGQKKVVTAYKLITRGTVEERILSLQTKKREAINAVIDSQSDFGEGLSDTDLHDLLFSET